MGYSCSVGCSSATAEYIISIAFFKTCALLIEEAAAYSNIGQNKLREISDNERCPFVLWVGNKRLIKRRQFDRYIDDCYSI